MPPADPQGLEVVIFGGGGAGLWLLDDLVSRGIGTLLLEAGDLGGGQTIASQGIIHGGLKYTLSGLLTPSAQTIKSMPERWRRCLAGEGAPDLRGTRLRAEYCHLWQTTSLRSRLSMIGARAGLQTAPVRIDRHARPPVLAQCPGLVARLDEQVIEPASLIADLARRHPGRILAIDAEYGLEFELDGPGQVELIRLINPQTGAPIDLRPRHVVFTAGAGNADLGRRVGLSGRTMQRRPLHMVVARGDLPVLNGHCIDGATARVTVTSTRDSANRAIWQIGGQIAEEGVEMEPPRLIAHAKAELFAVLPGLQLSGVDFSTYRIDRAEAATRGGFRPTDARYIRTGNVVSGWPTKLALVPRLAEKLGRSLGEPAGPRPPEAPDLGDWPHPRVALPPWEKEEQWSLGD